MHLFENKSDDPENDKILEAWKVGGNTLSLLVSGLMHKGYGDEEAFALALICKKIGSGSIEGQLFFKDVVEANLGTDGVLTQEELALEDEAIIPYL